MCCRCNRQNWNQGNGCGRRCGCGRQNNCCRCCRDNDNWNGNDNDNCNGNWNGRCRCCRNNDEVLMIRNGNADIVNLRNCGQISVYEMVEDEDDYCPYR